MVNIVVEPYEPLVFKAVELIESKEPHYFNGINKIILEQGHTPHFGKVQSDQPDIIYVSLQRIRTALAGQPEEKLVEKVAGVLAHEMGHLKSDFQGGEAPAEQEEQRMNNILNANLKKRLRASAFERKLKRYANVPNQTVPYQLADSILRVIYHFAQKVEQNNQRRFFRNIQERFTQVSPNEIAGRKKNPGGGLGSTISLTKNILAGQPIDIIMSTLAIVQSRISQL